MNILRNNISILVVGLFVVFLLSKNVFAAIDFYILAGDSTKNIYCDSLEIKNNQALCNANDLLITFEISHVKTIEVVNNGVAQYFKSFTQETISKINDLNSEKSVARKVQKQEDEKNNSIKYVRDVTYTFLDNLKFQESSNWLNTVLAFLGLIVFLIGSIGFLIAAFRKSILWGLSCTFLPFVSLFFLIVHWKTVAKPFIVSMFGIAIMFISTILLPTSEISQAVSKVSSDTKRANTSKNNTKFECRGKIYCSQMTSCDEAKFYLRNCPGVKMDGDNDGIPCEQQWCGH